MAALNYLPSFEADAVAIWSNIAKDNPTAASRLVDRLYRGCLLLSDHPLAGRERPDLAEGCRHLVVGHIVVLYRFDGDSVDLVRALDGRRNITGELFREGLSS